MLCRDSSSCDRMEAVKLQLVAKLDQTVVKVSVSEYRYRYCKCAISLKSALHIRQHLIRNSSRVDRRAEKYKILTFKARNTFPILRKCKIKCLHRHRKNFRRLFRHRCDYFFRVSCGAEIYRPYFCDLHNTSPFPLIYDSLLADKICFMNFFPSV